MCADPTAWASQAREVEIPASGAVLGGRFTPPPAGAGVVAFAHGSGSSRFSPRNTSVAAALERRGFGTLLFDLLTVDEASDRERVFDIPLLGERLIAATRWLRAQPEAAGWPAGYFGASTGAAAALYAAAELGEAVAAVVSRGGRPDLAGPRLEHVVAHALLIVGGADEEVLELNRAARARLRCPNELVVIPGATHLFEEPGALEAVIEHAADWFTRHFEAAAHARGG